MNIPIPLQVMSEIGNDLMSMEKGTKHGMNYIISAVDYFTKYCRLGVLPKKNVQWLPGFKIIYSADNDHAVITNYQPD